MRRRWNYLIADNQWLWYHVRRASAETIPAVSVYGSSLPVFGYCWSMKDDFWQQLCKLRWAIAKTYTIGSSILALWSWYYSDHNNEHQLWAYYRVSAKAILFTIGFFFQLFSTDIIWITTSSREYRRYITAVLSALGFFVGAFWGVFDMYEDERKQWHYLKSGRVEVSTNGFLLPAIRSSYSKNEDNKQWWHHLRSAIVLAFEFWFLFAVFGGCYCLNNGYQQLQLLKSTWSGLFTNELLLPSSLSCYIIVNDNWQHWSYLGSDTVGPSIQEPFLSVFWGWYLMNDGDKRCSEYLRFFIALLSSIDFLFPAFWSFWYTYHEL